ncbi:hypothetical protein BE17_08425 [Sorangium cellulosum]|uniref:Peptidase C51 domain-containing protein n=1 Tax=Sorangium cellulosum TaxID=56 RepID=A0A150REN7_SORCE|nr:hypothetical protein BE17_08425 [Sorangium cellulosum]
MASAAVSLVAFGSAPADAADACVDISDAALDLIADPTPVASGAVFFTAAQKLAFGYTSTDIAVLWGSTSPNSAQYYTNFSAGNHITQITNAAEIAAGDVLVIGASGTYTGHTAIVTGAAIPISALNPVYANTKQWAVPIADSTTTTHGCSVSFPDSRCVGGVFTAGEGTAFIRLYSDLSDSLVGYGFSWSVTSGATYYTPTARPYVIGRLTPCPPI